MANRTRVLILVLLFSVLGCKSTYYKVWEKLGKEKRDLLATHVGDVKDQQRENVEQVKDALTRLQEAYGKPDTKLQSFYDRLKADDENAQGRAEALQKRIDRMHTTAQDLFDEWDQEIRSFTNPEYKKKSRASLERARTRFGALSQALKKSTARMKPVLARLHETTLYLKHNLNARALGGMKRESREIERELEGLMGQMNASIKEADEFLGVLGDEE